MFMLLSKLDIKIKTLTKKSADAGELQSLFCATDGQNRDRNEAKARCLWCPWDPEHTHCLRPTGHNRWAPEKPQVHKKILWSWICMTFSWAAVSGNPREAWRNSCYSGKRTQNDSPAASVITTAPVSNINKLFQSYYSVLGTHSLCDRLPDKIWDMGTRPVPCVITHMCFVTTIFRYRPTTNIKSNFERHFL